MTAKQFIEIAEKCKAHGIHNIYNTTHGLAHTYTFGSYCYCMAQNMEGITVVQYDVCREFYRRPIGSHEEPIRIY